MTFREVELMIQEERNALTIADTFNSFSWSKLKLRNHKVISKQNGIFLTICLDPELSCSDLQLGVALLSG